MNQQGRVQETVASDQLKSGLLGEGEPRKTNVLFLIPTLQGGGAEKSLVDLLKSFTGRIKSTLAVFHLDEAVFLAKVPPDCEVVNLKCGQTRKSFSAILRLVWQRRPDVILVSLSHLNLLVGLVRWALPRNCRVIAQQVTILSAPVVVGKGWMAVWRRLLYRISYRNFDRIICVSAAVQEDLQNRFGLDRSKLEVIFNPIDLNDVKIQLADRHAAREAELYIASLPPKSRILIAAGGLNYNKGFDILIDALALCGDPTLQLLILGKGELKAELDQHIQLKGLTRQVHLVGFKANPYVWFQRSDIFVLSSRMEGFGNVMVEAMACGIPVIATPASGAIREILRDAPGCLVADDVSARSLAKALVTWSAQMPVRMKREAIKQFDIADISERYLITLKRVVKSNASPCL